MDSRKAEVYIDGLKSDMLVNSEDGRYIAWSEDGTTMHVTDLEKGESFDIHANENQLLKPLGFLGSDCIYGWGYRTDIFSTQTQTDTLALSQVLIVDTSDSAHSVLKTYETPGIYVTGIRIQDGSIYPVSYTHLALPENIPGAESGSYRRGGTASGRGTLFSSDPSDADAGNVSTVSYTHLDVYKRQYLLSKCTLWLKF